MRLRKSGRRCVRWSEDTLPEISAGAEGAHRSKIGHMYRLASAYGGTPRGASREPSDGSRDRHCAGD